MTTSQILFTSSKERTLIPLTETMTLRDLKRGLTKKGISTEGRIIYYGKTKLTNEDKKLIKDFGLSTVNRLNIVYLSELLASQDGDRQNSSSLLSILRRSYDNDVVADKPETKLRKDNNNFTIRELRKKYQLVSEQFFKGENSKGEQY
jgi:hypothetical protein